MGAVAGGGAALVIAAGVDGEPGYQDLRQPGQHLPGDLSYSLYLVHWPVIVILGALMKPSWAYYLSAVAPDVRPVDRSAPFRGTLLRNVGGSGAGGCWGEVRQRSFSVSRSNQLAGPGGRGVTGRCGVAYGVRPAPEDPRVGDEVRARHSAGGPEPVDRNPRRCAPRSKPR